MYCIRCVQKQTCGKQRSSRYRWRCGCRMGRECHPLCTIHTWSLWPGISDGIKKREFRQRCWRSDTAELISLQKLLTFKGSYHDNIFLSTFETFNSELTEIAGVECFTEHRHRKQTISSREIWTEQNRKKDFVFHCKNVF